MIYNTALINDIIESISNGENIRRDENPFLRGQIGVRKPFLKYKYTEEELNNLIKVKTDINYFINNFCKISNEDLKLNVNLRNYQKDYLDIIENNRFILHIKSRQIGSNLLNGIKILHYALSNNDKNSIIITNTKMTSIEIIDNIKDVYLNLPFYLKQGVKRWNQNSIEFENGSRIISNSIKNIPITYNYDYLYIDEFAYMPKNKVDIFYDKVIGALLVNGFSRLIISSTPNKTDNLFYKLCSNTKKGLQPFKLIETPYYVVENRDTSWVNNIISIIGKDAFEQEYNLKFLENKKEDNKNSNNKEKGIIERLDSIEKLLEIIIKKIN